METCCVRADIYNLMKILNVTVTDSRNGLFIGAHIVARKNNVTITLKHSEEVEQIQCRLLFVCLKFAEQSFHLDNIKNNSFSFHLQMETDESLKSSKLFATQQIISNQHEIRDLILSQKFTCSCAVCSKLLFCSDQFDEILPAGNYSEVAESSWCLCRCRSSSKRHRIEDFSGKYDKKMAAEKEKCYHHLSPETDAKSKMIFVSEKSLLYENDIKTIQSVMVESIKLLICSGCKVTLGASSNKFSAGYKQNIDSTMSQLYLHSLSFTFSQSSFQMWPKSVDDLQMKMSAMLVAGGSIGSRFVVEVRKDGSKLSPVVLMTLLSLDDVIYSLDCETLAGKHDLSPINVVKILVRHCQTSDDIQLAKKWLEDFSVENIEIPEWQRSNFLKALKHNNLMSGEEAIDGFGVSYLKKSGHSP